VAFGAVGQLRVWHRTDCTPAGWRFGSQSACLPAHIGSQQEPSAVVASGSRGLLTVVVVVMVVLSSAYHQPPASSRHASGTTPGAWRGDCRSTTRARRTWGAGASGATGAAPPGTGRGDIRRACATITARIPSASVRPSADGVIPSLRAGARSRRVRGVGTRCSCTRSARSPIRTAGCTPYPTRDTAA